MFKTMLAGKADPAKLQFPLYASPKLDGVRAHIIDGVVVSRNLIPFRNPGIQKRFGKKKKYNGLDGEFMVGDPTHPEAFRQTGLLNSHSGDCSEVKLHVFDTFRNPMAPFYGRLEVATMMAVENPHDLAIVSHETIACHQDLEVYEGQCLAAGYEGVMLRDIHGPYKYGRSTTNEGFLLKVKRFEDSEAVIVGTEEKMHNANEKTLVRNGKAVRNSRRDGLVSTGVLGAVTVRDVHTGVEFSVGSGFTDAERSALWYPDTRNNPIIGRIIKYQYFPTGSKDKPRFPTFKGFRDPGDM